MTTKAIVVGTGWAGEGHAIALQSVGVEVVAFCGRTRETTTAKAEKLSISNVRYDWRKAIDEFRPDIVTIATPATIHREICEVAARNGCHIMCEKPLGVSASEARAMLRAVSVAKVKHAYGATHGYAPTISYARELVATGRIGKVREIESVIHMHISPQLPFNWFHRVDQGGGMLNNMFTHQIERVRRITGGEVLAATGEARRLIERAPVGPAIHDFRKLYDSDARIDPIDAERGEWREVDADYGYTVVVQLRMPDGKQVSALFQACGTPNPHPDYLALYGSAGTLYIGGRSDVVQYFDLERNTWEDLAVPPDMVESLPQAVNGAQQHWNQLFREYVADVRGEGYAGYPTFREGWIACEIIGIVRKRGNWTDVPNGPEG